MSLPSTIDLSEAKSKVDALRNNINRSIFGQEELITETLTCLLSGGHILMTGAPGLAKTTLVRVFAESLSLAYGRVQFTPDLLPTDILGTDILNIDPETSQRSFEFAPGPIFVNLVLADEINRASPRTQSALLEAMQERSCTIAGKSYQLPAPFMVFATQNPFESEGAFPLPEAQMDRFLVHTLVDYPSLEAEKKILAAHAGSKLIGENFSEVIDDGFHKLSLDDLQQLIAATGKVSVSGDMIEMIGELVRSSRPTDSRCPESIKPMIWYGAGPRAGISLISVARAYALMEGAESVRWSHVKRMAKPVLRHRMRLSAGAGRDGMQTDDLIDQIIEHTETTFKIEADGVAG